MESPTTDPRILAYMVTKNEAGRYLDACLTWANTFLDGISVYDDLSSDATVEVAEKHGAQVRVRPEDVPSFLDHEGLFRQRAWRWFEEALEPQEGDWVLALDADEFLVSDIDVRPGLLRALAHAEASGSEAVLLKVPEVFDADEAYSGLYRYPRVRVDGFWGTIAGTRLFQYRPGGTFQNKAMGSGAEPTYVVNKAGSAYKALHLHLLHLGYMHPADREQKFERYTTLLDHGHANAHVQSIVTAPTLRPWEGSWPRVWRGVR